MVVMKAITMHPVGGGERASYSRPPCLVPFHKGEETATWVQTRYEPAAGLASYVYVVPTGHHTAMVDELADLRDEVAEHHLEEAADEDGAEHRRHGGPAFA